MLFFGETKFLAYFGGRLGISEDISINKLFFPTLPHQNLFCCPMEAAYKFNSGYTKRWNPDMKLLLGISVRKSQQ